MKKGFTLAEILITLGLVGILAAVTVPTLIRGILGNSMVRTARITQDQLIKVFQSSLGSKYGTAEYYPRLDSAEFYDELEKLLPVKSRSVFGGGVDLPDPYFALVYNGEKLYEGAIFELQNGVILTFASYDYNGNNPSTDGVMVRITIDVNGRKEPNTNGKDIYYMYFNTHPEREYEITNNSIPAWKGKIPYGKLYALGAYYTNDEDVRKMCYTGKTRTKFSQMNWHTVQVAGDGIAGWLNQGEACLEYLNRIKWDLRKYPVKDFTGDGE